MATSITAKETKEESDYKRAELRDAYSFLHAAVSELRCFLGIHTCSAFSTEFLEFPFELISFDLLSTGSETVFADQNLGAWQSALRRGVVIAPGTYPACIDSDPVLALNAGRSLFNAAQASIQALRPEALVLQSATCGHAGASNRWLQALYG